MVAATVYKEVRYVGKGLGTLKLYDNQLTFSMYDSRAENNTKIFTLPWTKVARRQVTSSERSRNPDRPKIKLILGSGTEAIFQMDDRIALEVLRDDIGERLTKYQALYPDQCFYEDEAVNKTRNSVSGRRESMPYRMAKPDLIPTTNPVARRASQPYRMAQPEKKTPKVTEWQRSAQPYRMAKPQPTITMKREAQPYRMKAATVEPTKRDAQPYRYVAKK